ncbi:MAG: hypothetical protein QM820_35675 [Minicystis sp.]
MAALEKAASAVYAFCGDQVCSPSEAAFQMSSSTGAYTTSPQCSTDCSYVGTSGSSTSSSKQAFATLSFGTLSQTYTNSPVLKGGGVTYTTAQATTLLTADGAHLDWQSDGNLVLYSSSGSTLWQSNTSGSGYKLALQTDGNVCIYNSSGSWIWGTQAVPSSTDQYTYRPVYLLLTNATLYAVDSSFHVWWSSDTDAHAYAFISSSMSAGSSPRYCWTKSAGDQYLAINAAHNLNFSMDGILRVNVNYGSAVWQSGIAGKSGTAVSGQYLCNQEDGNLVLYDASFNKVWSSGGGGGTLNYNFNGWGGDVELAGSRIETLAPSGDPTWGSSVCSGTDTFACQSAQGVATTTAKSSGTWKWYGGSTLLSNDYANLTFSSAGVLAVEDLTGEVAGYTTSPTKVWARSTSIPSGGTALAEFTEYGQFRFGYMSGSTFYIGWYTGNATTTTGQATLELAGCQVLVLDAADQAYYKGTTTCAYGNYNNATTWLID